MAPRAAHRRFVRPLILATVVAVGLAMLAPASAQARAPLPREDRFDVFAGSVISLDVLANDNALGGGETTVCEVSVADRDRQVIFAGADDDRVVVDIRPDTQGQVTFFYRACQGEDRSVQTRVVLSVTNLSTVKVTKRRGLQGSDRGSQP